jgi:hypothetical protein
LANVAGLADEEPGDGMGGVDDTAVRARWRAVDARATGAVLRVARTFFAGADPVDADRVGFGPVGAA